MLTSRQSLKVHDRRGLLRASTQGLWPQLTEADFFAEADFFGSRVDECSAVGRWRGQLVTKG
jgi:hypothetical protein